MVEEVGEIKRRKGRMSGRMRKKMREKDGNTDERSNENCKWKRKFLGMQNKVRKDIGWVIDMCACVCIRQDRIINNSNIEMYEMYEM